MVAGVMVSDIFEIMFFFQIFVINMPKVSCQMTKPLNYFFSFIIFMNFISFMAFIQKQSHQVNWRLLESVNKILWRFLLNLLLVMVET